MNSFDFQPRTRVIFGAESITQHGNHALQIGFSRKLVVADQGLVA
jgi:hypothetical protein